MIERLQTEGYTVDAPPNPLQSLKGDAATIADFLKTINGPIVLVGHSYGGAVITNAATGNRNVKALVYVDAFAPAKGESVLGLDSTKPGSALGAGPTKVFDFVPFPGAKNGDAELYVKSSVFAQAFANGLPAKEELFSPPPSRRRSTARSRRARERPLGRRSRAGMCSARPTRRSRRPSSCSWLSASMRTSPESRLAISRWWPIPGRSRT